MIKRRNITLAWLEKRNACEPALLVFKETFGETATIKAIVDHLHKINRPDWEAWLLSQEIFTAIAMVECGANIHAKNDYALCRASGRGRLPLVMYLVGQRADIHAFDDFGLRWAAGCGYFAVVRFLIQQGANVRAKNDHALCWAMEKGHTKVAKLLKRTAQK